MRLPIGRKYLFGLVGVGVITVILDVYAWFVGDQGLLTIFLVVSTVLAFWTWSSSNFGIRAIPRALAFLAGLWCVLAGLHGAYVLLNPGYRQSLVERQQQMAAAAAREIETLSSVARIVEEVDLIEQPVDGYRTGKMLVVLLRRGTPHLADVVSSPRISTSSDDFYVQVLRRGTTTANLGDAGTILWIQEHPQVVGSYNRKLLGPITADKTGDALKFTWKVWLIDANKRLVTAYKEFTGPNPPESIEISGDFGIPPQEDLAAWLDSLPTR